MTYDDSPLLPASPREALDQPIEQGEVRAGTGTSEAPAPPGIRLLIVVGPGEEEAAREAYEDLIDFSAKEALL